MLVPTEPLFVEGSVVLIPHQSMYRKRMGLVVVVTVGAEGLGEIEKLGEVLADGEIEAEGEELAEDDGERLCDAEGLRDDEGERLGLSDALAEADGDRLCEAEGEIEADGEIDADGLIETEALGERLGDAEADGETEADVIGLICTEIPSGKENGEPAGIGPTWGLCVFAAALNDMTGVFPKEVSPAYTSAIEVDPPPTR